MQYILIKIGFSKNVFEVFRPNSDVDKLGRSANINPHLSRVPCVVKTSKSREQGRESFNIDLFVRDSNSYFTYEVVFPGRQIQ